MTLALYALIVLIWGTTWIAIKFQLGTVAVPASVAYRFALAAAMLFAWLLATRSLQRLHAVDHGFCVLQGACLFSVNFLCFYTATGYITSGTVSVVFSTATLLNALNSRLFLGRTIAPRVLLGAALGVAGISGLFWNELTHAGADTLRGLLLAFAGTYCFSLGNIISTRHQARGLRPMSTNAWGMLYGTALLLAWAMVQGVPFGFDPAPAYGLALLYLALFGSVIGFWSYLTLVGRIGPERAAYATVLFPVVALSISTWLEGYRWTAAGGLGLLLVMAGNIIVFRQPKAATGASGNTAAGAAKARSAGTR